jgi:hypothetical protein
MLLIKVKDIKINDNKNGIKCNNNVFIRRPNS